MFRRLLLSTSLALTACPTGEESANNDSAPVDIQAAVDRIATSQCEKIFGCCADDELDRVFAGTDASDQTTCEDAIRAQAQAFLRPALERARDEEHITIDESALDLCIEALDGRQCDRFQPAVTANVLDVPGCEDFVTPQLTLSAFCFEDFECETGFCSVPPGSTEGACKSPPASGEPCLNDRCGEGLRCDMDGVCAEKLGEGEICTRNADCRSDVCSPNDDGEFVCEEIPLICNGP